MHGKKTIPPVRYTPTFRGSEGDLQLVVERCFCGGSGVLRNDATFDISDGKKHEAKDVCHYHIRWSSSGLDWKRLFLSRRLTIRPKNWSDRVKPTPLSNLTAIARNALRFWHGPHEERSRDGSAPNCTQYSPFAPASASNLSPIVNSAFVTEASQRTSHLREHEISARPSGGASRLPNSRRATMPRKKSARSFRRSILKAKPGIGTSTTTRSTTAGATRGELKPPLLSLMHSPFQNGKAALHRNSTVL